MGNYFKYIANLDRKERLGIESLGEFHKCSYRFGEHEHALVVEAVAYLCVLPNNSGPRDAQGLQGTWMGQRVMFVGDDDGHGWEASEGGYTSEGTTVSWNPESLYRETRSTFKDITPKVFAELCDRSEAMARRVARASLTDGEVRTLSFEILTLPDQQTGNLQRQMEMEWGRPLGEIPDAPLKLPATD